MQWPHLVTINVRFIWMRLLVFQFIFLTWICHYNDNSLVYFHSIFRKKKRTDDRPANKDNFDWFGAQTQIIRCVSYGSSVLTNCLVMPSRNERLFLCVDDNEQSAWIEQYTIVAAKWIDITNSVFSVECRAHKSVYISYKLQTKHSHHVTVRWFSYQLEEVSRLPLNRHSIQFKIYILTNLYSILSILAVRWKMCHKLYVARVTTTLYNKYTPNGWANELNHCWIQLTSTLIYRWANSRPFIK